MQTLYLQVFIIKKWQKKSIIALDSVIESDEKYYPQTFLEKCKYVQEKIKFENYFDEELDSDSDNDE